MPTILVLDDDPIILTFVSSLLRDKGFTVITAEDGSLGLDLARRRRPDLIISDLVMPYRDGFEILRELKGDPRLREVPVIVVSMKDSEPDIVRGFDLGAEDYIVKPFGAHELLARIRRVLRHRPPAPAAATRGEASPNR
jgi:DNA-binding response OmpR family regulator